MAVNQADRRLKFWGWGYEDQQPPAAELREAGAELRAALGFEPCEVEQPPRLEDIELPRPRIEPPSSLADVCSTDRYERVTHAYGKGYRDIVRAFRGRIDHAPDVVARPRDEREVEALLDWCSRARAAAIPFGGGTSVVGGVEARVGDAYTGAVAIDLRRLDRVLEVDSTSGAARIQAGALGPALEVELGRDGLTLRHFPQSFEYSTLGGWIATRSGGHFATLATHIDDLVESVRAVSPSGVWESWRLPGSGAGPSPDRQLIGSEGTLGVITEAWVKVRERPRFRASASVRFASFADGAAAARAIVQAGLWPSNCRLLDAGEAARSGVDADGGAVLLVGFESPSFPLDASLRTALECCGDHRGAVLDSRSRDAAAPARDGGSAAGQWRSAFLSAPYIRDTLVAAGVFVETYETAHVWAGLDDFVQRVERRAVEALAELCGGGHVSCRLTHVYPDGAAPYFTVLAPALRGAEVDQWARIKAAIADVISDAGATVTHHHAVGRDHREWYDRQRPDPFARAFVAAKRALDPAGVLNPGVLIDPAPATAAGSV